MHCSRIHVVRSGRVERCGRSVRLMASGESGTAECGEAMHVTMDPFAPHHVYILSPGAGAVHTCRTRQVNSAKWAGKFFAFPLHFIFSHPPPHKFLISADFNHHRLIHHVSPVFWS